jgi:beta-xylosidase
MGDTETIPVPAWPDYFADPFVWEWGGDYFAIGTGPREAAGAMAGEPCVFPLLRSRDLQHWEAAGAALERPDPALGGNFWAPEVAPAHGRFWLYYSVGFGDQLHQIRVAVADHPLGPYRDARETALVAPLDPPFAIDPHPFYDAAEEAWLLFYARDRLDGPRPGTALMVDRLVAMDRVAGEPREVLRARHDWQRFQRHRPRYGGIWDWHTLEGPCVRRHEGRLFCFYSGGRWENASYGVDVVEADTALGPYHETGEASRARVLHTVPGRLIGPGHNAIVTGPDGRDWIAYHAWDAGMTARRMFLEPLLWTPAGPRCAHEAE